MYTARKKIQKEKDVEPTEFEETVAQVSFVNIMYSLYKTFNDLDKFWLSFYRPFLTWRTLIRSLKVT